ncbi:septum formation initiator family protein [bacterium]|nr:septum formation initiator family protein [bacterium]
MGPSSCFSVTFCPVAPLARLRGGMDTVQVGYEIQQLEAEVVELKAEVQRLKAEVVELNDEDTKQTTEARLGSTIVVAFTEDEAIEMLDIAEETRRCGQSLVDLSVDICGPCNAWSPTSIADFDGMERDSNRIVTLSSRLLQLLREQSSASSREV